MKTISTIFIFLISILASAQKQADYWYFGNQSGLNFSSGSPVSITGGQTGTDVGPGGVQEGTACISDSTGSLLFYTGGKIIWNKFHNPMPNGTGLFGGLSSTQSSIIIPHPGNIHKFFVFTSDEFQSYFTPPNKGYCYSIVDMCLDNDKGDVIPGQKNIPLLDSATEKLAACYDFAAGNSYWVMGHKMFTTEFHAWHVTALGISDTVVSSVGTLHGWQYGPSTWQNGAAQGQMKFNPTGTKLAVAISNNDPAVLDIFDFNPSTGIVSNPCHIVIDSAMGKRIYGIEFSPDGGKLYASVSGGSGGKRIYQYDVYASGGMCSSVEASRTTIFQSNYNSVMFGMQLAPNNKIYVVGNSYYDLGCINFPNLTGVAVSYDSSAVAISGVMNNYMLPSFIAGNNYYSGIPSCTINVINETVSENSIDFYPNPMNTFGTLKIDPEINIKGLSLFVYDELGRIINKINITTHETIVKREELPKGIYFYSLRSVNEIIKTGKVIVE